MYHKVLQVPLPSWHSSIDTLTVWKRTKSSIVDGAVYAYIPEDQRLDLTAASPSTRHLLLCGNTNNDVVAAATAGKRHNGENETESAENGGEGEQRANGDSTVAHASGTKRVKR